MGAAGGWAAAAAEAVRWPLEAQAHGEAFRGRLGAAELGTVEHAQMWFLLSQYAAMLLYYLGAAERPCKFPASISYTASKGPPKYAFLLLWARGWSLLLRAFWAAAGPGAGLFALQMFSTGLLAMGFNRPGQGQLANLLHMVGAVFYIADHVVFLVFMDVAQVYRNVFYASFALTGVAMHCTGVIKKAAGLPPKYASGAAEWRSMLAAAGKAGPHWRARLWWSEMAFMLFENLIFTSFILGMASGLPASA